MARKGRRLLCSPSASLTLDTILVFRRRTLQREAFFHGFAIPMPEGFSKAVSFRLPYTKAPRIRKIEMLSSIP